MKLRSLLMMAVGALGIASAQISNAQEKWSGIDGPTMGFVLDSGAGVRIMHGLPGSAHWSKPLEGTTDGRQVAGQYLLRESGELVYLPTMAKIGEQSWSRLAVGADGSSVAAIDASGTKVLLAKQGAQVFQSDLPGQALDMVVLGQDSVLLSSASGLWLLDGEGKLASEVGLAGITAMTAMGSRALLTADGIHLYSAGQLERLSQDKQQVLQASSRQRLFVARDADGQVFLWRGKEDGTWAQSLLPIPGTDLSAAAVWQGRGLLLEGAADQPAWFINLEMPESADSKEMVTRVPPMKTQVEGEQR